MEVVKVLGRKDGVKMAIIPKHSTIQKGDYIQIIKLEETKDGKKRKS